MEFLVATGAVDRQTSERELRSALLREYTYVPMEKLSMPVDGGGVLSLVGAIADKAGNLSKPLAPYPVSPEPGQIMLMFPALLRGDRVLANLEMGAGTGPSLGGNPAVALYAPPEGLFVFALQPFEAATACKVTLGRASCTLEGNDYTLLSARPITGGDQESKIWVLREPRYIPSKVGVNWRDREASKPDAVIEMAASYDVLAAGTVEYTYFVVPTGLTEDKWVQSLEVRAGSRQVVHHIALSSRAPMARTCRGVRAKRPPKRCCCCLRRTTGPFRKH